jgi:hypothetical protein
MHGATDYTQTEKGERRRRRIEKERERENTRLQRWTGSR